MEKRYILALILMALVMFGWSFWFGRHIPKRNRRQTTEQTAKPSEKTPQTTSDESAAPSGESEQTEESTHYRQQVQESQTVHVQTENYEVTFAVEPAIAREWKLKKYPDRSSTGESAINLIPETALNCLSIQFPDPQLQLDAMRANWEVDKTELVLTEQNPQGSLTFSTQIGDDLKVFKTLTFYYDRYFVDLGLTFQNLSDQPLTALDTASDEHGGYKLRWGPGINADLLPHELKNGGRGRRRTRGEGTRAYTGFGKPAQELGESQLMDTVLWAGINDKYFAALMIPDPALNAQYQRELLKDNGETPPVDITDPRGAASLVIPEFSLNPSQTRTDQYRVFVGPKEEKTLKAIHAPNAPEKPLRLTRIIDFGFFWPIAWAMLWVLHGLERVVRNYGIAIILLTLLTKLVSYPLTRKSYKSMKEMQRLQPLLTELREKYRDDPQKLNRATMQLYKEHGVNPLGGCLPWIPQLPIFWALFSILGSAVELRGAPFFLWIKDLSAPDTLFHLPFTIPLIVTEIDAVRLLPLINGVTTWLQQRVTGGMTPSADNTQAKFMQFMPLLFVFLFYNWASGFVLYWLCNNLFTIGQQYFTRLGEPNQTEAVPSLPTNKPSQPKKRKPSKMKT